MHSNDVTADEQRIMDMGDAIAHVWKALDAIHESEHLTRDDLHEIVDQAKGSWVPDLEHT